LGYPLGDEAHEGGADAHGGGGGDVREDVGGEEEVDGAVVRVEGWVEAGAHGVVHDHGEAVGAEVDGGAQEPVHGLPDGSDVADLLAPELGGDFGGAEVERRPPGAGGARPARGEVAVPAHLMTSATWTADCVRSATWDGDVYQNRGGMAWGGRKVSGLDSWLASAVWFCSSRAKIGRM